MNRYQKKTGLPPGSLIYVGTKNSGEITNKKINYNKLQFQEEQNIGIEQMQIHKEEEMTWVNINGVHDPDYIEKICNNFDIHPLIMEDIMNTDQRTKIEDYGDYLFIVLKMLKYDYQEEKIEVEQLSLIQGEDYIISFQEIEGDVFDYVRKRLREGRGKIRENNADYLMYSLIDAVVDNYFLVLEKFGEEIDLLQEELLQEDGKESLEEIHDLKSNLITLRRYILPLRAELNTLIRERSIHISKDTAYYIRDIYDHALRINEKMDSHRELLNGLMDIYLSLSNNKMNSVMKRLTIIATIFMPLTLITGIYGMNFKYMPELEYQWSYPTVMGIMLVVVVIMLIYFKKKKML